MRTPPFTRERLLNHFPKWIKKLLTNGNIDMVHCWCERYPSTIIAISFPLCDENHRGKIWSTLASFGNWNITYCVDYRSYVITNTYWYLNRIIVIMLVGTRFNPTTRSTIAMQFHDRAWMYVCSLSPHPGQCVLVCNARGMHGNKRAQRWRLPSQEARPVWRNLRIHACMHARMDTSMAPPFRHIRYYIIIWGSHRIWRESRGAGYHIWQDVEDILQSPITETPIYYNCVYYSNK